MMDMYKWVTESFSVIKHRSLINVNSPYFNKLDLKYWDLINVNSICILVYLIHPNIIPNTRFQSNCYFYDIAMCFYLMDLLQKQVLEVKFADCFKIAFMWILKFDLSNFSQLPRLHKGRFLSESDNSA